MERWRGNEGRVVITVRNRERVTTGGHEQGGKQKENEWIGGAERGGREGEKARGKNMKERKKKNGNPSPLVRIRKEDIPLHSIEKALNHLQGEIKPLAWHPAASL